MRCCILLTVLCFLAAAPSALHAQIKNAIFDENKDQLKNVTYKEATTGSDFRHGKLMKVTMNDNSTVTGTLVRVDRTNDRLYVRTAPGAMPKAIALNDIKRVDKAVIKQVNFEGDASYPEIQQTVIYNGLRKSVSYVAPSLSPSETARLNELAAAENEVARLEYATRQEDVLRDADFDLQLEQRRTQEILNHLLWRQFEVGGYFTVPRFDPLYGGYNPTSAAFPWPVAPAIGPYAPIATTQAVVVNRTPISYETVAKARQNLVALQSRAIVENGQVIAVIAEDK
jgi:hypothetical protein